MCSTCDGIFIGVLMSELYLIRHGRTEANEKWLYCGSTDLFLSEKGTEDLKDISYDVPGDTLFITSGMRRTEQTLKILFGDVPHRIDERFREVDFGVFEMKSYESLKEQEDYQTWISGDNEKNVPPKGESGEQMKIRVLKGLEDVQKEERPVILVCHGGVIAAIMEHLYPNENKNRYLWQPKPGHGYLIKDGKYQEI
jgi:alpha-ribazole phosphatase